MVFSYFLVPYGADFSATFKGDRYKPTRFQREKALLEGMLSDTERNPDGTLAEPQDRIGKVSIGKDSIGEDSADGSDASSAPKLSPTPYGRYKNVFMTDEEYAELRRDYPSDYSDRIERMSEYIASTGKKYKSHPAAIRSWARHDGITPQSGEALKTKVQKFVESSRYLLDDE